MRQRKNDPVVASEQVRGMVKRVRDLMRMDKGLSGELDRLPLLSWLLLLRLLDRDDEAVVTAPYRWRDWAHGFDATPDELLDFMTGSSVTRPDGTVGPGLLMHLASLPGDGEDERVVRECFAKVTCPLQSGAILQRVAEQLDRAALVSSEDIHMLGDLYESLLQEMRDAAGDSGEFYTPRPLTRTIIDILDPQPGETVLDPACGTCGFLVEATARWRLGGEKDGEATGGVNLVGWEAKPLPHLLGRMNLLLHGQPAASVDLRNSLDIPDLGAVAGCADVVATNPPFGGREEATVVSGFPADRQTSETALLFLQLIVATLRQGGRAAVVLPNGSLFAGGVAVRIRSDLMADCTLSMVLRLPGGAFAPYTTIPTNVLFFTKGQPTENVWFYELDLPEGRKAYTKTKPLRYEDLADFRAWAACPAPTSAAWQVGIGEIEEDDYSLDRSNPAGLVDEGTHGDPALVVRDLLEDSRTLTAELEAIEHELGAVG